MRKSILIKRTSIILVLSCAIFIIFLTIQKNQNSNKRKQNTPHLKKKKHQQKYRPFQYIDQTLDDATTSSNPQSRPTIQSQQNPKVKINAKTNSKDKKLPASDNSLYKPIYGDPIVRSNSKAIFHLYDGKDKELESGIIQKVRIWRHIRHDLWLEDYAEYDEDKKVLNCSGYKNLGLEPGDYVVEIDGGGYGLLKFKFHIQRNQEIHDIYYMPNYSKIIKLHFVDIKGNNIQHLDNQPIYTYEKNKKPFNKYQKKNRLILRDQPKEDGFGIGGGGSGGAFGKKTYPKKPAFKTDEGIFYFRIFVGQKGTLKYKYSKSEKKRGSFVHSSKFSSDNEDYFKIVMTPIQFKKKSRYIEFKNNPGNRKITKQFSPRLLDLEKVFDHNTTGFSGQLISTRYPVMMKFLNSNCRGNEIIQSTNFQFQKNIEKDVFSPDNRYYYQWTDKKFFQTKMIEIKIKKDLITYFSESLDLEKFKISFNLSPTLFNLTKDMAYVTKNYFPVKSGINSSDKLKIKLLPKKETLSLTSLYGPDNNNLTKALSHLQFTFEGFTYGFWRLTMADKSSLHQPFSIDQKVLLNSDKHHAVSSPFSNIMILRTINFQDGGLPWVEASLNRHEDKKYTVALKKVMADPITDTFMKNLSIYEYHLLKKRYSLRATSITIKAIKKNSTNPDDFEEEVEVTYTPATPKEIKRDKDNEKKYKDYKVYTEKDKSEEFISDISLNGTSEKTLKEINEKYFTLKSILKEDYYLWDYYLNHGAWYNTHNKGLSDAKGYMIIKTPTLIPGKKYTLYFWSESKDHLKPDKEITFIAQEGITDLGAIKF